MQRVFLLLLIILFELMPRISGQTNDSLPNILIIIADDFGLDAMNGYSVGSIKPVTPHLDSLRAAGLTFSNAWADPVCTSTRASTMSGKYGIKTGVLTAPGNLDTIHTSIFNQINLRTNDSYATATIGKWHVAKPAIEEHPHWHGVDEYMGVLSSGWNAYDEWMKTESDVTDTCFEYATAYFTDYAADWINNQNQPWMMWLAQIAPHTPLHIPPAGTYSQPSTNSQIKKYMAMIENMDYEIGRLFDSIPQDVLNNTLIFFLGDNGTPDNVLQDYPANRGKQTVYQGGVNVPLVVTGPGVARVGEVEDALVNVLDIYGTITVMLESAMADSGGIYNSRSFYHLLSNSGGAVRTYNYAELAPNGINIFVNAYTIRNDRYKLIQFLDVLDNDSTQAFYDLLVDPFELNDLLTGTLTGDQQNALDDLIVEALSIRSGWSCRDGIKNGNETDVDCGGTYCSSCTVDLSNAEINDLVKIYPNPVTDILNLEFTNGENAFDWELNISNIRGQELHVETKQTQIGYTLAVKNINEPVIIIKLIHRTSGNSIIKKVVLSK